MTPAEIIEAMRDANLARIAHMRDGERVEGLADTPRPRGKRAAGKPWREEVREMIDAETKALRETVGWLNARVAALEFEAGPRPWWRFFG